MKNQRLTVIWGISLFILCVATLLLVGVKIVDIGVSDILIRVLGVVELITLPICAFVSVKIFSKPK